LTWLSVKLKSEQSKLTKENASQLVKPLFGCMGDRSGGFYLLIYFFKFLSMKIPTSCFKKLN